MNLAVDSRPLTGDIFSALDYSGLQVYGLEHLPLHRAARSIRNFEDGRKWCVELSECTWDDGRPIGPEEYLAGLNCLLKAQPRFASYFATILKKASYSKNQLSLEFSRPIAVGGGLFDIPNWGPFRAGHRSGKYKISPVGDAWTIEDRLGGKGHLHLVSSPTENENLFGAGLLDFSADTALYLSELDDSVHRCDTGLFGILVYSTLLTDGRALALTMALGDLKFSTEIEFAYPSLRPSYSVPVEAKSLRIAYDNFYPNREICEEIAAHLSQKGWHVELVEDDYYRPSARTDVKFMILRHSGSRGVFPAFTIASLPRAAVRAAEISEIIATLEAGIEYESGWLAEMHLGFPLFRIPSFCRARGSQSNPLLEVFA